MEVKTTPCKQKTDETSDSNFNSIKIKLSDDFKKINNKLM